ncbi:MAG: phosphopantothenate/pantothenate synthetase [archaeon]|nr:phosphopantothenate/pantothenate synthetase [archaeon]MDA1131301.1 phosphopantothenate/pantothenate synthetase [archaeon]
MSDFAADKSHPRYQSLLMRHRLEMAAKAGMLADSALIAHGRGEAFDYLLGEATIASAHDATMEALAHLQNADSAVISLNGNAIALAGKELMQLASLLKIPVEVNIFYRTPERMKALLNHLYEIRDTNQLDVEILGENPDAKIPGLEGPRAKCCENGIYNSDVILVPLEDGDRCEALVAMGKVVLVIDLNPLSRSAKMGSVTIVDELSRVADNLLHGAMQKITRIPRSDYDNNNILQSAIDHITSSLS